MIEQRFKRKVLCRFANAVRTFLVRKLPEIWRVPLKLPCTSNFSQTSQEVPREERGSRQRVGTYRGRRGVSVTKLFFFVATDGGTK
jgi:hypothetical protein